MTDVATERGTSFPLILVIAIVAFVALGCFWYLLPIAECDVCQGSGKNFFDATCATCNGTGKVTLDVRRTLNTRLSPSTTP